MGKRKKIAIYAGSFDPPTIGHIDIIKRASAIFAELHVVVAQNNRKKYLLPVEERISLMEEICLKMKNVQVAATSALIVEYMREQDIRIIVRGVRNAEDFAAETGMACWNNALYPKAETVFLPPDPILAHVSSSGVKEIIAFGGDFSHFVPPLVGEALTKKLKAGIIDVDLLVAGTGSAHLLDEQMPDERGNPLRDVQVPEDKEVL
jgi:pantetheine-phosphate adenylyltransferase